MSRTRTTTARPKPSVPRAESPGTHGLTAIRARGLYASGMAIPLVLLVVAAFSPCLDNGFVQWDDDENFLENFSYRGLGWSQVRWAWTSFRIGVYQPLAWMILEAQYALWGLQPRGYHLASLVLHAINTVVLFVLTVALLERCRPGHAVESPRDLSVPLGAGLAVALFAVHPLRTEVVAWASCQPYLPCALFSMLAVLAYLRGLRGGPSPRRGWPAASFCLFAAALLSKAVAVSLPAILLILDVYPLRRLGGGPGQWFGATQRRVWAEKVPFAGLSLVFIIVAIIGRKQERALVDVQHWGVAARIAQAGYGIWAYPIMTVFPSDITAFYPLPRDMKWYEPPFLAGILGTLVVCVGVFVLRRRWPALPAAWSSYLVILAPNLGIIRIGNQIAADRYSYIAMLGGVVLLAGCFRACWQARPRGWHVPVATAAASSGVILGLVILTRGQCKTWKTSESLFTHALEHGAGRSLLVHNNLGTSFVRQGRVEEAMAQYAEALRLDPSSAEAHKNLGAALVLRGRLGEGMGHLAEAIRFAPDDAEAHNNLGVALYRQGRVEEAMAQHLEALRLDPNDADVHNNLAMIWASDPRAEYRDGRRAVAAATRAGVLTGWEEPRVLDTLAAACAEEGDFEAAVKWQSRAIDLLTNEAEKDAYRSRLHLYQAGKPYREEIEGR